MDKFVVLSSADQNKNSWKWQHPRRRIAVIETNGIDMPKQIHPNHKSVVKIVKTWEMCYVGTTDRCQFARALAEAEDLCEKLNLASESS